MRNGERRTDARDETNYHLASRIVMSAILAAERW
jgi:hypothetical protein